MAKRKKTIQKITVQEAWNCLRDVYGCDDKNLSISELENRAKDIARRSVWSCAEPVVEKIETALKNSSASLSDEETKKRLAILRFAVETRRIHIYFTN